MNFKIQEENKQKLEEILGEEIASRLLENYKNSIFFQEGKHNYIANFTEFFFECERCGSCCKVSPTPLYPADIMLLYFHLKEEIFDKIVFFEWNDKIALGLKEVNGHCTYYDSDNKKCNVHEFKPLVCALAPLKVNIGKENNEFYLNFLFNIGENFCKSLLKSKKKINVFEYVSPYKGRLIEKYYFLNELNKRVSERENKDKKNLIIAAIKTYSKFLPEKILLGILKKII